jgi:hypothetical protein
MADDKVGYLRALLANVLTSEMFLRRLKIEHGPGDNADFKEASENNIKNKKMFLEEAEQYPDALRILKRESLLYGYKYLVPVGEDEQIVEKSKTLRNVIPNLIAKALHIPPPSTELDFESERGGKRSRKRKRKLNKNKIKSSKRRRIVKNKRKSR